MKKMSLSEQEVNELKTVNANKESDWYKVCDKIKKRRNGQFPGYLSREILKLYQEKYPDITG